MTSNETQKTLENEEPSEEFREWIGTKFGQYNEYGTPDSVVRKMWIAYQKGIHDVRMKKAKPHHWKNINCDMEGDECPVCDSDLAMKWIHCPGCGVKLDWSEWNERN